MIRGMPVILVLLLCLHVPGVRAERDQELKHTIKGHKAQMGEVRRELKQGRAKIKVMRQRERLILDRLDQMELELQLIREKQERQEQERKNLRQDISLKRKRLKELTRDLERLRVHLGQRLQALYKFGHQAYLNLLVSVQDVSEFQHHWVYLRTIVEEDSKLIQKFQDRQAKEKKLTQVLTLREEQLVKLAKEIEQQRTKMEDVKREQVALLQEIHNQEEMYQRYVEELAAVSRQLERKIDELQKQIGQADQVFHQPKGGFASKKGALPYPVPGKVVSHFGPKQHKKFGTTIRNNGIEVTTEQMSPIAAVYPGKVLYSSWVKGYGKVIIIDHGDKYYTLTAHLGEVVKAAGEAVEAGELIGYAGYSPVHGEGGRIYFEIRYLGKPLDPEAWLLPILASAAAADKK